MIGPGRAAFLLFLAATSQQSWAKGFTLAVGPCPAPYEVIFSDGFGDIPEPADMVSFIPDSGQLTSYTATCGEDADYATHPQSYSADIPTGIVTDNVTGLVWQEPFAGYHNWYEATGTQHVTLNPSGLTDVCGNLTLAGFGDWRLPTKRELLRIVDFDKVWYAINDVFTGESAPFWTSDSRDSVHAWYVRFTGYYDNYVSYWIQKFTTNLVRCVRGDELAGSFEDNGDGTVSDNVTGLMWQQTDLLNGELPPIRNWEEALTHCENLDFAGFGDWRLPNITELESVSDADPISVASDASHYWSSTSTTDQSDFRPQVWTVNFLHTYIFFREKTSYSYALCTRTAHQ